MMASPPAKQSPHAWVLNSGQMVDHFCVMRPLGHGGMAEVYLARDTKLGRKVALAWDGDRLLAASANKVTSYTVRGEKAAASVSVDVGVTAMGRVGPYLATGYSDGNIELIPQKAGLERPRFSFAKVPSCPVVRLISGPPGTLIASFANGLVGLWNLDNGTRMEHFQLHGPVVHLMLHKGKLYAASELGHQRVLDLGVFQADRCQLLQQIWVTVPTAWEDGLPMLRRPPEGHPCLPRELKRKK